jgi:hypothetical protein
LNNAHLVWREFAGDRYNSFSNYLWASKLYTIFPLSYNIFLLILILIYGCRMYCVLSKLGDHKSADVIFKKLPRALFKKKVNAKVNAKDLRLGTKVNAKVYQICAHGLVLDLAGGVRGMYHFEVESYLCFISVSFFFICTVFLGAGLHFHF